MEPKDLRATTALPGVEPAKEAEITPSGDLDVSVDEGSAKNFLILVVDDSADNVAVLSLALQQQGYRSLPPTVRKQLVWPL